jgi:hypothetical protein
VHEDCVYWQQVADVFGQALYMAIQPCADVSADTMASTCCPAIQQVRCPF